MCKHKVNQHLLVTNLYCVSINNIPVTECITVKVSLNLNLMQNMSTQWNQQLIRYLFLKVIECLEQNIRKQIDYKRLSSTKQINRVKDIRLETCK